MRAALLLALAPVVGCGDALVERGYRGVPLHTFEGQITTVEGDGTFEHPLRASVFWSPSGETTAASSALAT